MKIVFLGEDSFSAVVLDSLILAKHNVLAVVCPLYINNVHSRLELVCNKHNIKFSRVDDVNSIRVQKYLQNLNPDLIVVCHFQKVLKKNIIKIPSKGCINLHPSLLPYYRGMSPQHWPIINGDNETGITVHFINEGIDTGDIILQQKVEIKPNMYVFDLQIEMLKIYKEIVKKSLDLLLNKKIKFIKQNNLVGSYYGRLKKSQCVININDDYLKAYNLIRAVSNPYFGARLNDYVIWRAEIADKKLNFNIQNEFKKNNIYFDNKYGNFIKFKKGTLIIKKYGKLKN
ncbi:MAG: methionyl-tRNA formyltransferase [Flavobacteriaceae bacterium]|nr:methionyl-tRNA formyltransferase [Flavobacteriaceae bacterium]